MIPKPLFIVLLSLILIACAFCGYQVHELSSRQQQTRTDYSIMNNVSFGLLSVSKWRDQVVAIVGQKIQHFKLQPSQKVELKKEIEQIMAALLTEAFKKINQPNKTLGGKIKKVAVKALVDTADLKRQIPSFAQKIIDEIEKPSSINKVKDIAQSELEQLGTDTYDSSVREEKHLSDSVFAKYEVTTREDFDKKSVALLHSLRAQSYAYSYGLFATMACILLLWLILWKQPDLQRTLFLFSVFVAFVFLIIGVTSTMIELDARIGSMDLHLIGSDVSFKNQVLFFQSKSILDVVKILIVTGKIDMVVVGILVLCFSVFFPVLKLASTLVALYGGKKWASSPVVNFFAYHSGKWSMADVTVVAIMMTYIGFNGVVANSLSDLNINTDSFASIATNNTTLQPGYIIFVGFVIFSLFLSTVLKKITTQKKEK